MCIRDRLKDRFDPAELREIIDEIDQMKQAGQLLTNYDYTGLEIKTAGTVKAIDVYKRQVRDGEQLQPRADTGGCAG